MEQIALLGSTGSIGTSSIEVIKRHLDKFEFFLLTADKNSSLLLKQCKELNPKYVFINDVKASIKFKSDLNSLSLNKMDLLISRQFLFITNGMTSERFQI